MIDGKLPVLVLGLGSNVSQGILKALRMSRLDCRVLGACVSPQSAGLYAADTWQISPLAASPDFEPWLFEVCRDERVAAVLSGVEPVLEVLARVAPALHAETGARCVVSSPAVFAVGLDKLATCRWLEEHELAHPRYAAGDDGAAIDRLVAGCGWPLVAKPRTGRGSHGVVVVTSPAELGPIRGRADYVLQEYLGDADVEFSTGCFSDRDGAVRGSVVMRRLLTAGTTTFAELGDFPEVRAEALKVASALGPMGPLNVQSRLHGGRAVTFELNVRFSGTTPIRAHFGFNEVEAALRHFILDEPLADLPSPREGTAARYWEELYIDAGGKVTRGPFLPGS